MKKFLLIVLLFLLPLMVANAQDLEKLRRNLDAPLQGLDFSKIPTGILAERAVELLPFDAYDGVLRDSNYSDYASQAMLYLSLASLSKEIVRHFVFLLTNSFFFLYIRHSITH